MALFGGDSRSVDDFWGAYKTWEDKLRDDFLGHHKEAGIDPNVAKSMSDASVSLRDMLQTLPYKDRQRAVAEFRNTVTKFDQNFKSTMWQEVGPGGGSNGVKVGRAIMDKGAETADPLSFLMRQLSIQMDPSKEGSEAYSFGQNIPTSEYLKNLFDKSQPGKGIGDNKSILVFDTETMGLETNLGGVREVSATQMRKAGDKFTVDIAGSETKQFSVARAAYGGIYDKSKKRIVRMDKWMGSSGLPSGGGEDFIQNLLPILQKMKNSDYIAGHNVGFDIGQVILNATKTSEYQNAKVINGVNVKELVDSIIAKIKKGDVIDTLVMARQYFGNDLALAPELKAYAKPSAYGLENIMMETNLSRLLQKDLGDSFIQKIVKQGQHTADVDTVITSKLLEYMHGDRLKIRRLGKNGSARELALRRSTLRAYAPTPVSNIADISHISPELFQRLHGEDGSLNIVRMVTGEVQDVKSKSAGEWYSELTSDTTPFVASPKLTPMEQHIFSTRALVPGAEDATDETMLNALGSWKRFSSYDVPYKGTLNRLHTLFKRADIPDDEAFAKFNQRMFESGMPFSGLSPEERILTGAFSSTAKLGSTVHDLLKESSTAESSFAAMGEDFGITKFAAQQTFDNPGGVASIPLDVMKQAEEAGILGSHFTDNHLQMLSLSAVDSSKSINVRYDATEEETTKLLDWMQTHIEDDASTIGHSMKQQGLSSGFIEDMRTSMIDEGRHTQGITVGFLNGKAGEQAHAALSDMLQNLTRDKDKVPFRVGFMSEKHGVMDTGAVILDRLMTAKDKVAYTEDLISAGKKSSRLIDAISKDTGKGLRASFMYKTGMGDLAEKIDKGYHFFHKNALAMAATGALLVGGAVAYRKKKKQDVYDDSMGEMPMQSKGDYAKYRRDMGLPYAPAVRRLDPLLYAGTVGNADRNAVNHDVMSNKRYSNLYSGAIG